MSTIASSIIARVHEVVRDAKTGNAGIVYTTAAAVEWINDAQRVITILRPDAKSSIDSWQLISGTKQSIPSTARRLMGLIRNMGDSGDTPGAAIRGPVPQEDLDGYDPAWHTKTDTEISEYVYTEETETSFYVSPGVITTTYVEGRLAMFPVDCADEEASIDLADIYVPVIIEWCLYRFFSRDDERTPNWTRAGRHFSNVFNLLQVKRQADMAVSPKVVEYR